MFIKENGYDLASASLKCSYCIHLQALRLNSSSVTRVRIIQHLESLSLITSLRCVTQIIFQFSCDTLQHENKLPRL